MTADAKAAASIPLEWRQSASEALMELADAMARGSMSLARKSARLMGSDPKAHRVVIATLRTYASTTMPCNEDMHRIVALLTGVPEDQCRSAAAERRAVRLEERIAHDKAWWRIMESPDRREAWERHCGARKATKSRDGNVVTGPWPTAD